jgi:hypothetical protein
VHTLAAIRSSLRHLAASLWYFHAADRRFESLQVYLLSYSTIAIAGLCFSVFKANSRIVLSARL